MTDKRDTDRIDVELPVVLTWPGNGVYHGTTHNVSDGGVYLSAGFDPPPQAGTEVTLRVAKAGDGVDVPTLRARVVRADLKGVALKFLGRTDDGE